MPSAKPRPAASGWLMLAIVIPIACASLYWIAGEAQAIASAILSGRGIQGGLAGIVRLVIVGAGIILFAFIPYFIAAAGRHANPIYCANLAILVSPFISWDLVGWSLIGWFILLAAAIQHRKPTP